MSQAAFRALVRDVATELAGRPLETALGALLNARHGPGSATYAALREACLAGIAEGWMCAREAGGIRYGRVETPAPDLGGCSVDVVDMRDVVGPQHAHPAGEIDLVMPLEGDARFDGHGAGWLVYPPGSVHSPTVAGGRALVLYLLPDGRIDFIR